MPNLLKICCRFGLLCTLVLSATTSVGSTAMSKSSDERPNFLLIVLDDLAYSDLGSFGGEMHTPNLDRLANEGIRFTNFYAAAACAPSRAMLLTGADNHLVGLGNVAEFVTPKQQGQPGYEGLLNNRVDTVATRLRTEGYHTYMVGKWHLGSVAGSRPHEQGFDHSFALMEGGANHFDQRGVTSEQPRAEYLEDGKPVSLPDSFFSSQTYTDKLIEHLNADRDDNKPFFAYLAYTAPHWPLQAPSHYIERNSGKYDRGYDLLRRQRLQNMQALGIISKTQATADAGIAKATGYRPWAELNDEERRRQVRLMEVYAAMVEAVDEQVGRVLNLLQAQGKLENTVIVFLSDNGAEGFDKSHWPPFASWVEQFDNRYEALGTKESFAFYGPGWATAGTAPFRMFKGFGTDGGLRVPAFVWAPNMSRQRVISDELVTVMDVTPTLLELAGVSAGDVKQQGQWGRSMLPYLKGQKPEIHSSDSALGWEFIGNAAIRKGDWKLVRAFKPFGTGEWQLFNVAQDPSEIHDLAASHPDKFRELRADWDVYARENGVLLPEWGWKDRMKKAYLFGREAL